MNNIQTSFSCTCGNEGWIGVNDITTPCDFCGNVYYGEIVKHKSGCTVIKAKLLQSDIDILVSDTWWSRIKRIFK